MPFNSLLNLLFPSIHSLWQHPCGSLPSIPQQREGNTKRGKIAAARQMSNGERLLSWVPRLGVARFVSQNPCLVMVTSSLTCLPSYFQLVRCLGCHFCLFVRMLVLSPGLFSYLVDCLPFLFAGLLYRFSSPLLAFLPNWWFPAYDWLTFA